MSQIQQTAGRCEVETWTDGAPWWFKVKFDDRELGSMRLSDIRDLQYCLERVVERLPKKRLAEDNP